MTDTQQPQEELQFKAFARLLQKLSDNGIDQEAQGFILGRLMKAVIDRATVEVFDVVGAEELARIEQLEDPGQQQREIATAFLQKKGVSVDSYREQLAEELVADFEAQG